MLDIQLLRSDPEGVAKRLADRADRPALDGHVGRRQQRARFVECKHRDVFNEESHTLTALTARRRVQCAQIRQVPADGAPSAGMTA